MNNTSVTNTASNQSIINTKILPFNATAFHLMKEGKANINTKSARIMTDNPKLKAQYESYSKEDKNLTYALMGIKDKHERILSSKVMKMILQARLKELSQNILE